MDVDISECFDEPGITSPSSLGVHLLSMIVIILFHIDIDLKTKFDFELSNIIDGIISSNLSYLGLNLKLFLIEIG